MKERMKEKPPSQPQTFWHAKNNTCRILKLINRLFTFSVARKTFYTQAQLEFWEYNTHAFEIEYTLSCHGQGQRPLEIVRH